MRRSESNCEGGRDWGLPGRGSFGVPLLVCAILCLFLSGCGLGEWLRNGLKVGPNYKKPQAPIASNWIDYQRAEAEAATQPQELKQWWHAFNDPVLNSLISDAYQQNLTLRVAGERIAEARAVRGIAVGNFWPQQQDVSGSYSAVKGSDRGANAVQDQWF